jgi:eukaryotic-like serine/threonine-protein kinase
VPYGQARVMDAQGRFNSFFDVQVQSERTDREDEAPLSAPRLISTTSVEPPSFGRQRPMQTASGTMPKAYEAGELIGGKYLLRQKLGEGGMGAVWRAYNELLEVEFALKLIRAEEMLAPDGAHLGDRLLQEARAAARLGHPAIARVFDFGTTDRGDPYIVMELLKGEDLAEALARRGRINATKAVQTMLPIAHALAAAHATGIVHRDLKPENVYLARAEDGRVQPKLVDFGIAKIERKQSNRLTQTGTMLGSPVYMSPEQARGGDVDHLADVWALCVVLYEMVTGRPPFEGKNYNALLYSIIADAPPSITSFSAGDDDLWAILMRGFEKEPAKRWQSIREVGEALARWLINRGVNEDITGASISAQWLRQQNHGDVLTSMLPAAGEHFEMPEIPRAQSVTVMRSNPARSMVPSSVSRVRELGRVASLSLLIGVFCVSALALALRRPKLAPDTNVAALEVEAPIVRVLPQVEVEAVVAEVPPIAPSLGVKPPAAPEQRSSKHKPNGKPSLANLPKPKLKNPFDSE